MSKKPEPKKNGYSPNSRPVYCGELTVSERKDIAKLPAEIRRTILLNAAAKYKPLPTPKPSPKKANKSVTKKTAAKSVKSKIKPVAKKIAPKPAGIELVPAVVEQEQLPF